MLGIDLEKSGTGRILRLNKAWDPEGVMLRACEAFAIDYGMTILLIITSSIQQSREEVD